MTVVPTSLWAIAASCSGVHMGGGGGPAASVEFEPGDDIALRLQEISNKYLGGESIDEDAMPMNGERQRERPTSQTDGNAP